MKKRFTTEQIIKILKDGESGKKVADICREYNLSDSTFYTWKSRYGGMGISEVQRLKDLETENSKRKRIVADLTLDNTDLKDVLPKKW
jgi:putative transposase